MRAAVAMRRARNRVNHRWIRRLCGAAVCAAACAVLPYGVYRESGVPHMLELRDQVRTFAERNRRLRADNDALAREIHALKTDPAEVERVARDELGLVKPGDEVYELEPAAPGVASR